MSRSTTKVTFRRFKPCEIEDELRDYCARLQVERNFPAARRKKLETPPVWRIEMPTYWAAVLEPIKSEELDHYQSDPLVQAPDGRVCVARQFCETGESVWLRTSGEKFEQKTGGARLILDIADFEPFESRREPSSDLRLLAAEARSLFRADVVDRGRDLLEHLLPGGLEGPLPDPIIAVFRNLLLEAGVTVPVPSEGAQDRTRETDQKTEALWRGGLSLTESIRRVGDDRIDRDMEEDGSSKSGTRLSERIKDWKSEFQDRRWKRLGLPRDPLELEMMKKVARLTLSFEIDEILKDLHWWARVVAGVKVARHYLDSVKKADERMIGSAKSAEGGFADTLGKPIDLANAENRLTRFKAMDDRALKIAFQWEPAWLEIVLSRQAVDIQACIEEIVSSVDRFTERAAA